MQTKPDVLAHAEAAQDHLRPLQGVGEGQPVGGVGGEQPHGVALVHGQRHVGQVAQDEDKLLAEDIHPQPVGSSLETLESLFHREQGLEWPEGGC